MRTPPALLVLAAIAPAVARAGDCDPLVAAAKQLDAVAYRVHSVMTGAPGSEPEVGDMIATGDKVYVAMGDGWQAVPRDAMAAGDFADEVASGNVSCRRLDDATIDGTATSAFALTDATQPDLTSQTVWIARDSGRVVRVHEARDEGGGDAGKSEMVVDFSYTDVAPPPGAD